MAFQFKDTTYIKRTLRFSQALSIIFILLGCDPALRIEVINETPRSIFIEIDSLDCNLFTEHYYSNQIDTLIGGIKVLPGKENSYMFYLGIGGWIKEEHEKMKLCLDSLNKFDLERQAELEILKSDSYTTDFGHSKMVYRLFLE